MRIRKLVLREFRNLKQAEFFPDPRLNFLIGQNGQGKSSVLEAISYLSTLRSFRGAKSAEVIRYGTPAADISAEISTADGLIGESLGDNIQAQLRILFQKTDEFGTKASKSAFINGKGYRSSTQYLSQRFGDFELGFHSIIFNPSDHDLVRGDPAGRRSFIDRVLTAEDPAYLKTLTRYQKTLEQRNALLRTLEVPNPPLLLGYSEMLATDAAWLCRARLEWLSRLLNLITDNYSRIAPGSLPLRIFYLSNWAPEIDGLCIPNGHLGLVNFSGLSPLPSLELLEQSFWKRLSSLEAAEWRNRSSLVGTHRDDWAFYLGDQPLKGYGSQGEVRSALLALKLCEVTLFRERTGHRPLFLLDDFSSELDRDRRSQLLRFLNETDLQVFVTTTDESFLSEWSQATSAGKKFRVSEGILFE